MRQPNILFFLSDQHSYKYLNENMTPNLCALSREGTSFDNAYCQNPLCVPSRACLLTGRYSKNLGIYENRHIMQSGIETLPRALSRAGYKTCLVGKTHINGEQFAGYNERPYGDFLGQGHQPEYPRTGLEADESGLGDILENAGATSIPLPMTQTEICVAESVKWLQRHKAVCPEKPFFLSVNFDKPHFPYRCPQSFFEKYEGRAALPEYPADYANTGAVEFVRKAFEINGAWEHYGKDPDIHKRALAAYAGCVEWVDDAVGRILDALDFLGLSDDTVVIYSTDHGEMAGEKGAWQKTVFFEPSARVPLIFRWPKAIAADTVKHGLAGLVDLFPTLCSLTGTPQPDTYDGTDLSGCILGSADSPRGAVFSESTVLKVPEHAGCMLRDNRYKYNYYLSGKHELYDLEADPNELNNLIHDARYASVAAAMRRKTEAFWEPDKQLLRYERCPRMEREKHFYLSSNQFFSANGEMFDAVP